jgi:pimeloyl-ACP methyl ester carboxylesterase
MTLALLGCGSSSSQSSPDAAAAATEAGAIGTPPGAPAKCPVVVSAAACDTTQRPIVFVHGTYSSGGDIEHMAALLGSNGFCQDHIVAIDYDSVAASATSTSGVDSPGADCTAPNTPVGCGMIDMAITNILQKFPQFKQVDLMGHSQGTFHCGTYLANHADRVAHYINFSGIPDVGNVDTLSLSSHRDLFDCPHHATGTSICGYAQTADGGTEVVPPAFLGSSDGGIGCSVPMEGGAAEPAATEGGAAEGGSDDGGPACNVVQYTLQDQDHFAVAASKDSFIQVYKYLTGQDPKYTDIQCGDDPVTVEGIAETFADNVPQQGTIVISEVGPTPRNTAVFKMVTPDATGHFGPIQLSRNVEYSFTSNALDGGTPIGHAYFTPFMRDNRLVRLLTPASSSDGSPVGGLVAPMTTGKAVTSATTVVAIARWGQGGIRQDLGASLTVNGVNVLDSANSGTEAAMTGAGAGLAPLQGGVAALFMEDANKNGMTDLGLVTEATFIAFTDVFIDATKPGFVDLAFTGGSEDPTTVSVPLVLDNWPSSQGLVYTVFQ